MHKRMKHLKSNLPAMTSALYLEHYLDGLENLPNELQRNFKLMRDLDTRAQLLMKQIDEKANLFMETLIKEPVPEEERKEKLKGIQDSFNLAKEYGDDKVQLAIQTYELVDKHIRRLDSDLARFEGEIQDKTLNARSKSEEIVGKKGRKKGKDVKTVTKKKRAASSEDDEQRGNTGTSQKTNKKQKVNQEKEGRKGQKKSVDPEESLVNAAGGTPQSDVLDMPLDMPVDPNEPTYCLCHQVSYGEMIGCDNLECPIEWFHFACVGLVTKPKGKWFCSKCSQDRKKNFICCKNTTLKGYVIMSYFPNPKNGPASLTPPAPGPALQQHSFGNNHINEGLQNLPSPPVIVSGSEVSSSVDLRGSVSPQAQQQQKVSAGMENLANKVQCNIKLVGDLETRGELLIKQIDEKANQFMEALIKEPVPEEEREEKLERIQDLFNLAIEYAEGQVHMAIQTYDLVDKHIRRMDSDLAPFEGEMQDKTLNAGSKSEEIVGKKGRKKGADVKTVTEKKRAASSEDDDEQRGNTGTSQKTNKKQKKSVDPEESLVNAAGGTPQSDVLDMPLDMPVDPNEPTYCFCNQVSYGEMIECVNVECPIEWFHFACVGLATEPNGKWVCSDKTLNARSKSEEIVGKKRRKKRKDVKTVTKKKRAASSEQRGNTSTSQKTNKKQKKSVDPEESLVNAAGGTPQSDVLDMPLDMPVDPNEPTYCLCHQVSYGEMIGCDNLECPIEWFHFACVGLVTKPKGKCFCSKCSQDRKKK
ncbi:Inhibitor of growth protein 4 [Pseudolycoriella hygida]|uniref:Inhibitor of growth protein n=1 Tax=Pseudolycoriella hygida TaxID=35572 RepID=A0A9Q0N923_9DIPT|nr:Inhibitor of growth protein 4 [Pseudolycoriella hygida]